ncbi:MAG: isochorismatase family protein [Pirellulales bacterium]
MISDSGVEIWNLLAAHGIDRVLLCGVHTNMCVLGRPFGLRRLASNGKQVRLIRDLTDTMYNPASKPYAAHHSGTSLIVSHIERYVCPTIESTQLIGGDAAKFSDDLRRVTMMIGEDEYETWETLPRFADTTLRPLGYDVTIVHASKTDPNDFPGIVESLKKTDVLILSVRRRTPPKAQLDAVRDYLNAGKPLIGIRTASHAFAVRDPKTFVASAERAIWQDFDPEVLGGRYTGHHGKVCAAYRSHLG